MTKISSFDIFDTCLVRKCGTPENMLDVLSLRVFSGPVEEWVRQQFVIARKEACQKVWMDVPKGTIKDIYHSLEFEHPSLKSIEELIAIECDLEQELLLPVISVRDNIDALRAKGNHIIYISDMYLPQEFVEGILRNTGFIKDGDSLYVSCNVGKTKESGDLYDYIREVEHLNVKEWTHYGDNQLSDCEIARKKGIKAKLIKHQYNPYPANWYHSDFSISFKFPSVVAGLSRAICLSNPENSHKDLILDVAAPFYCSWMCQVLEDAQRQHVSKLFFMARDAYMIHKIALVMQQYYPDVQIDYIYSSRFALYERIDNEAAKIEYLKQKGVATNLGKVAIVDTTSTGKTLLNLNKLLVEHGFEKVYGYYFILWHNIENNERSFFNAPILNDYLLHNRLRHNLYGQLFLLENFFALNNELKTVDYVVENGIAKPVYDTQQGKEDCVVTDGVDWASIHQNLYEQYAEGWMELGLDKYANAIFSQIAIPTIYQFAELPIKYYLEALTSYRSYFGEYSQRYTSYVSRKWLPLVLLNIKRDYCWRRGTIIYNTPNWILKLLRKS